MKRGWTRAAMAALTLTLLTGCSPQVSGTGGVRLDGSGRLVAVLAWCESFGYPAKIALYPVRPDGGVGDALLMLDRTGDAPDADYAEIPLADPGPAWHADPAAPSLEDGKSYELRAWDNTGNHRVTSFPFTISELRTADPAQPILTKTYADGRYSSTFAGIEEFRQSATNNCDN